MTKRQLIDEIVVLNQTAKPAFLSKFNDGALSDYLHHLLQSRRPRLFGDSHRYDKYFVKDTPTPVSQRQASAPEAHNEAPSEQTAVEETVALEQEAIDPGRPSQPRVANEPADEPVEESGEDSNFTYGYTFLPSVHSQDDEDDSEDLGINSADDHADEQRETVSVSLAAADQDRPKDNNDTWLF